MKTRNFFSFGIALLIAGCASIDGTYAPDCTAYAGDEIVLSGGRFSWDKFTDAIPVDDDGNPMDATPGYPKQGDYTVEGSVVRLMPDDGASAVRMHLIELGGNSYLLTQEQAEALEIQGEMPDCPLARR